MKSETFSQSDPKRKILYYLKVMKQAGLKDLSKVMKISRMAVHKHLSDLQDRGLVESMEIRKGVGRPTMQYSLTSTGKTAFPKSYGEIATHALDYLEKNMGKDAVESVLRERQKELLEKYSVRMKDMKFNERVNELARIRDEEGYFAESKKDRKRNSHTLLEYIWNIIVQ
ncbi:MAG: ArsR family transcriptional regulator [Candidatus Nitrosocosmicus sp.]|nr:ArsR family transcriptional regulator [Candidatus Nitrosocosmicus sp.]